MDGNKILLSEKEIPSYSNPSYDVLQGAPLQMEEKVPFCRKAVCTFKDKQCLAFSCVSGAIHLNPVFQHLWRICIRLGKQSLKDYRVKGRL